MKFFRRFNFSLAKEGQPAAHIGCLKQWWRGLFAKFFVSLLLISCSSTIGIIGLSTWERQSELHEALSEDSLRTLIVSETISVQALFPEGDLSEMQCSAMTELIMRRVFDSAVLRGARGNSFEQAMKEGRIAVSYSGITAEQCRYPLYVSDQLQPLIHEATEQALRQRATVPLSTTTTDYWINVIAVPFSPIIGGGR